MGLRKRSLNIGVVKKQAERLFDEGQCDAAETLLDRHRRQFNKDIEAWFLLGIIQLKQEKFQEAKTAFLQVLSLNPDVVEAHTNLGSVYRGLGDFGKAQKHLHCALAINPRFLPALHGLGVVYCKCSDFDKGIDCFKEVLSFNPAALDAMKNIGDAYRGKADYAQSEFWYRRAIAHTPSYLPAKLSLVHVFRIRKEKEKLRELMNTLLEEYKGNTDVVIAFAHSCHMLEEEDKALRMLHEYLAKEDVNSKHSIAVYFRIAAILDRKKEFAQAFSFYEKANRLLSGNYIRDDIEKRVNNSIVFFNHAYFEEKKDTKDAEAAGNEFIFIVGMPRSGTSLLEQILDSHSGVRGVGELIKISQIASSLSPAGDFKVLNSLDDKKLHTLRQEYRKHLLQQLRGKAGDSTRFVDKMPFNYLYLGLIITLFPKATIIHCRRNPLDTCLSSYFQMYGGDIPFAFDLSDLGHYYGQYHKLMAHWEAVLGDRLLAVDYEDLVTHSDTRVRNILHDCGLPWEQECLDFYKNKRLIATASVEQVNRPLYKSSIGRWKKYASCLQPLYDALDEAGLDISRFAKQG